MAGVSGLTLIPRKIAGSEINTIEELMTAIRTPRVVFERATHLYRSDSAGPTVAGCVGDLTFTLTRLYYRSWSGTAGGLLM